MLKLIGAMHAAKFYPKTGNMIEMIRPTWAGWPQHATTVRNAEIDQRRKRNPPYTAKGCAGVTVRGSENATETACATPSSWKYAPKV